MALRPLVEPASITCLHVFLHAHGTSDISLDDMGRGVERGNTASARRSITEHSSGGCGHFPWGLHSPSEGRCRLPSCEDVYSAALERAWTMNETLELDDLTILSKYLLLFVTLTKCGRGDSLETCRSHTGSGATGCILHERLVHVAS